MEENLIEIKNKEIGKIVVFLASKLDYIDKSHMTTSQSDVNAYFNEIKNNFPGVATKLGIPFKFGDVKNTVVYLKEKENKTFLNVKEFNRNYQINAGCLVRHEFVDYERKNGRIL